MGNYINKALLGTNPYAERQGEVKKYVDKWDRTGLLDGLNEGVDRSNMAQILENQAKHLIKESTGTGTGGGATGGGYNGDEEWSGVALPLVRRIFSEIAAQDFVSVQPMNLPSGLVFYLDYKYGTASQLGSAGKGESVFGDTGRYSPSGSSAPYADGGSGFYGAGKYGYTSPTASVSVENLNTAGVTGSQASPVDYNFNTELSQSATSTTGGGLAAFSMTVSGVSELDTLAVRTWNITFDPAGTGAKTQWTGSTGGGKYNSSGVIPETIKFVGEEGGGSGTLSWVATGSWKDGAGGTPIANMSGSVAVVGPKYTTATTRGDFEQSEAGFGANPETDLSIPEINLELKSRAIVAKTRKLKAVWTPELAQDLNAYHSVDAEAELTSMLSEYVSMEIDLEILDMLIADAQTTDYWSVKVGSHYDSSTRSFTSGTANSGTEYALTRFEWYQTLVEKIQKVSNEIHKLTLRGGANFCVVSPKIATILESLPGYNANIGGGDVAANKQFAMGVTKIGAVNNTFQVYKNPYMTENTILVGFRGSNFLETGAVYAPYVPLIMTPLVYDPKNFQPRKGVMTRYAKKMIRPEFYGKIYVKDLELL